MLSNSVLVVTPTSNPEEVAIRGQLHEILEPVPCLPKLQKLGSLLRGREYDEGHEEDEDLSESEDGRQVSTRAYVSICCSSHLYCSLRNADSPTTMHGKRFKQAIMSLKRVFEKGGSWCSMVRHLGV